MNLRWPAGPASVWAPWYAVLWRLVWVVPWLVFRAGYVATTGLMLGHGELQRAWDDTR